MERYNFGLRGHDIGKNFPEMCEKARENKVSLLQFALAKTCNNIDFDEVGYDEAISFEVKEKLANHKLKVAVLGCYINPVDPIDDVRNTQLKRFANFLYYAKDFKVGVIGTETGMTDTIENTHTPKNYLSFLKNMTPIIEKAEALNVKIGIEPVWRYTIYSVEMMRKMLDDMKSDSLSVILDISNMITIENHSTQDYMIQSAFECLGESISTIHLKDFKIENGRKFFAPAGTGFLNVKSIFDNVNMMKKKPEIILDELPLSMYAETKKRIFEQIN